MENFGKFMVALMDLTIAPIINGFVVTNLWMWFVVPTFNANPLRIIEAIGLMFLINYIKAGRSKPSKDGEVWRDFIASISAMIAMASLALFTGWIAQMFM